MLRSSLLVLSIITAMTMPASAHGAFAIGGDPQQASRYGFATGLSYDYDTQEGADERALSECRVRDTGHPYETTALCNLVATVDHAWLVIAEDPKDGSTGFGWSVDTDKAVATRKAITQCKASSPTDRKTFCSVANDVQDTKP